MAIYKDVEPLEIVIYQGGNEDFDRGAKFILEKLDALPTADVVEVVRCKDCEHSFFIKSCSKYECKKGCGSLKYSNDFCSYGERNDK